MIRVISPGEYDAAARLHPALCPLVAVGDTRCGRRLLSDADADAACGFTAALEGVGGSGCVGDVPVLRLIQAASAVAQRLRRLATTAAAAACSAVPGFGQHRLNSELGCCDVAEAGAHSAQRRAEMQGLRLFTCTESQKRRFKQRASTKPFR